jgi:2-polyprenyl-3-methyl-5-hydroxy-6-metoxy-1,4-benzoquinol methylase
MPPLDASTARQDNWSAHWSEYADSASENPAQQMRHRLLLKQLKAIGQDIGLLIDVGSGQGDFLAAVVQSGVARRCVGFELSDTGVRISGTKVPAANFYQVDLFVPPPEISSFEGQADVVVCSEVIEHVDDPVGFCRQLKAFVKRGGQVLVSVPAGPMSAFDHYIGHRRHYTKAALTQVLSSAGFTIESVRGAGFPFFNLYRMVVILAGKRLIAGAQAAARATPTGLLASAAMAVFRVLMRFNLPLSAGGWQLVAVARRAEESSATEAASP